MKPEISVLVRTFEYLVAEVTKGVGVIAATGQEMVAADFADKVGANSGVQLVDTLLHTLAVTQELERCIALGIHTATSGCSNSTMLMVAFRQAVAVREVQDACTKVQLEAAAEARGWS